MTKYKLTDKYNMMINMTIEAAWVKGPVVRLMFPPS